VDVYVQAKEKANEKAAYALVSLLLTHKADPNSVDDKAASLLPRCFLFVDHFSTAETNSVDCRCSKQQFGSCTRSPYFNARCAFAYFVVTTHSFGRLVCNCRSPMSKDEALFTTAFYQSMMKNSALVLKIFLSRALDHDFGVQKTLRCFVWCMLKPRR
jgi:hypothetical protein